MVDDDPDNFRILISYMRTFSTESQTSQDKRQRYRLLFNTCDKNKDGLVSKKELYSMVKRSNNIAKHVAFQLLESADANGDGQLSFEEFVNLIENPKLKHFFRGGFQSYVESIVPKRRLTLLDNGNKLENFEAAILGTDNKYEDEYTCWPPPLGLLTIVLLTALLYILDGKLSISSTPYGNGTISHWLVYDPWKRYQVWRYVSYIFVHVGFYHIVVNLVILLLLGIPLEMVHKSWRVLLIYFAGALASSLVSSVADPYRKLAGASGAVYAILTAHISTLILNWNETSFAVYHLLFFVSITMLDLGAAIYNLCVDKNDERISILAHIAGAVTGICIGIDILRNLHVTMWEVYFKRIALMVYLSMLGGAILVNLTCSAHFPEQI